MNTVRLGNTDLMVSEVGFGGISIIPLSKDKAVSVIRHCLDLGINFFDTANLYHDSEEKCPYNLPITDLLKENLALYRESL